MTTITGLLVALAVLPGQIIPDVSLKWVLEGHTRDVYAVAFSPDNRTLASASSDGTVRVWSLATGKEVFSLDERPLWLGSVAFIDGGKTLLVSGHRLADRLDGHPGRLAWWDLKTKKVVRTLAFKNWSGWFHLSPDGRLMLMRGEGDEYLTFYLRDSGTGKVVGKIVPPGTGPWAFTPDSKHLLLDVGSGKVEVRDLKTQKVVRTIRVDGAAARGLSALAVSPDGKRFAAGQVLADKNFATAIIDLATGKEIARGPGYPNQGALVFTRRGQWLVRGGNGHGLFIHNARNMALLTESITTEERPRDIVISPNEKWLAIPNGYKKDVVVYKLGVR